MAQQEAQERLLSEQFAQSVSSGAENASGKKKEEEEEEDESEPIDEEGVDAKDIELVMQQVSRRETPIRLNVCGGGSADRLASFVQVSCSRRKAVKALKESNGDRE